MQSEEQLTFRDTNEYIEFSEGVKSAFSSCSEPIVLFGIPLKAKAVSINWEGVQANLRRTLSSVFNQTDKNFHIIVCGHDRPYLGEYDGRVSWLPANWAVPETKEQFSNDKARKRKWILVNIRQIVSGGLYYFLLDADDFVSKKLVSYIRKDDNRSGYYVDKGFVFDLSAGNFARMSEKTRPFYKSCGSCAAFWLSKEDMPTRLGDKSTFWSMLKDHGQFPEICRENGRPIEPIPFFAALYMLNHGNNNTELKKNNVVQTRHALEFKIKKAGEVEKIIKNFLPVAPTLCE